MEYTGSYHLPITCALQAAGLFVSAVTPQLIHSFGNHSIRKRRYDKADALKIANYELINWIDLPGYVPDEDIRQSLKAFSRQYNKYNKVKTMLTSNLISLPGRTFPCWKELFTFQTREKDGHEKWLDPAARFWHCGCAGDFSPRV